MSNLDDIVREYDCFDEESAVIQASAAAELAELRAEIKLQYDIAENNQRAFDHLEEMNNQIYAELAAEKNAVAEARVKISIIRAECEAWMRKSPSVPSELDTELGVPAGSVAKFVKDNPPIQRGAEHE